MLSLDQSFPSEANWLLAALSVETAARITAQSRTVALRIKDILFEVDAAIDYVYFPQSGCLSMITIMDTGTAVEVGTVGYEGMGGVSLVHGVESVPMQCIVQIPGMAKRMARAQFDVELRTDPAFAILLARYAQVWADQVARSGACNAVHSIDERCARWLLVTHDRVDSDVLPLTQEFLAIMLGVRRPSVTLAARTLHQAGLIDYKRGKITILDRMGLEAAACNCYAAIQASYATRLPIRPRRKLTPS